jgi:hypothetical protein
VFALTVCQALKFTVLSTDDLYLRCSFEFLALFIPLHTFPALLLSQSILNLSMTIYVSNLGNRITNESLEVLFATYGTISSSRLVTGEKGGNVAFVGMPDHKEAELAIARLNGSIVDGCALEAKEARR